MATPNERFKDVRIACGKTQEQWSDVVGITREGISSIESGRRKVTEKHLKALKQFAEKPINVDYIKTGEGSMFYDVGRNVQIQAFANSVMKMKDDAFVKKFAYALSKLDEKDWIALEKIIRKLSEGD